MMLILELPLSALTLTGILRWFSRHGRNLVPTRSKQTPKVSCIITCYSEGDGIKQTILTLKEQLYRGEIEIIAVIDGAKANADTYKAACDCLPVFNDAVRRQLVLLPKWQRGGRVSTLNAGSSISTGNIVINVDGDTSFWWVLKRGNKL